MKRSLVLSVWGLALAVGLVGCAHPGAETAAQPVALPSQPQSAETPIDLWLQRRSAPERIHCSIPAEEAPSAVADFERLSGEVYELYQSVCQDAERVARGERALPEALPPSADEAAREAQRTAAQAAITAGYQATLGEIENQSKALTLYAENLRSDSSISNITDRLDQNRTCNLLGGDSAKLRRQLKEAEDGAALILRSRMEATQAPAER